jgi:DNA primase
MAVGNLDNTIVAQIQQAADITDVVGEHVSLKRRGREMIGLCPFHDDHRPSLYVSGAKQIFKCFACGAGGDVFKFIQMRENLSFPQAVERLARRQGIELKWGKAPKSRHPKADPNRLAAVNAWAAAHFHDNLLKRPAGRHALQYVTGRKITMEAVRKWQIGAAADHPGDLLEAAGKSGVSVNLLSTAGLAVPRSRGADFGDRFVNRLMFPIRDVTGRVIGFGGRSLTGSGPKYINSPATVLFDKSSSLYGLDQARHSIVSGGTVVVVEGYTDCIMAHDKGCCNVAATLGTSFTAGHARILRRYAKTIVLVFDSDTAGVEAANRALEICLAQCIDIKLASLDKGKDPCEFLLNAGAEQFRRRIDEALDVFEFKWNRLLAGFDADNLSDRREAVSDFLQSVATGMTGGSLSIIERGLIINRLAHVIGLDPADVNAALAAKLRSSRRTQDLRKSSRPEDRPFLGTGYFAAAQRELLEVLLCKPEFYEHLVGKITPGVFDVPLLRQAAEAVFEIIAAGGDSSLAGILARVESVETAGVIVSLAQSGEEKGNFRERFIGAMDAIERGRSRGRKDGLKNLDETEFLHRFTENTAKRDPRNIGMV